MANLKSKNDFTADVVKLVAKATGTKPPNGEELLPPELAKQYLAAKAKLRRKPSGK